jgi:peptidoglycan/xylan/chitin deacetylase (PgdA/CDA1 family)
MHGGRCLALICCLLATVANAQPPEARAAAVAATPSAPTTAAEPAKSIDRRLVVTIDDLPWASFGDSAWPVEEGKSIPPRVAEAHQRLMAALRKEALPVIGFVNEGKLLAGDRVDTARVHLLRDWLDAGAELGNHTYGHADLHAVGLDAYEGEILQGEIFLRPLLEERGLEPRWFRHPYLRAGRTLQDKARLQAFLGAHGYRIAPVTVDTSDWVWAAAYRRTVANAGIQDGLREETLARLRREYVPYMLAKVDYFERQSIALLGYNLPQILLLHANEINADCYGELIAGLRTRGYRFVGLDEAMQDPAYLRADAYTGRWGPSWIHRWAIGEGRSREFYAGEPKVDAWVMELAGVDSE